MKIDYFEMHMVLARKARAIMNADDPPLFVAGVLADMLIMLRNQPLNEKEAQRVIEAFCDEMKIEQQETPMGDLVWAWVNNEDA